MKTMKYNEMQDDETLVLPKTRMSKESKHSRSKLGTPLRGVTPNVQNERSANLKSRNDNLGKLENKKSHHLHTPSFEKTLR